MANNLLKAADYPIVNEQMEFGTESGINIAIMGENVKKGQTLMFYILMQPPEYIGSTLLYL